MDVEWSIFASKQLVKITKYVADNFGYKTADKTLDKLVDKANSLARYPEASTIDYDLSDDEFTVRHTLVLPNAMYYVIKGDCIIVAAVMHSKQSPETIRGSVKRALEQYR